MGDLNLVTALSTGLALQLAAHNPGGDRWVKHVRLDTIESARTVSGRRSGE